MKKIKKILLSPLSKTLTLKFVVNKNYLRIKYVTQKYLFFTQEIFEILAT